MCVSCGVSFRVCMCVGLRVLWLPSVTCVGHVLSLSGWGRRRSRETAEHKGEMQIGRQAAGRRPARAPQTPTPKLLRLEVSLGLDCTCCHDALVFNHVLPPTHASLVPSLTPNPTIPHLQATLKPLPMWFSLKSKTSIHLVASICKTSSHSEKDSLLLAIFCPPLRQPGHQTHKRSTPFGAMTEAVPPHTHSYAWVLFLSPCCSQRD